MNEFRRMERSVSRMTMFAGVCVVVFYGCIFGAVGFVLWMIYRAGVTNGWL